MCLTYVPAASILNSHDVWKCYAAAKNRREEEAKKIRSPYGSHLSMGRLGEGLNCTWPPWPSRKAAVSMAPVNLLILVPRGSKT
jgi:hypothetical protein